MGKDTRETSNFVSKFLYNTGKKQRKISKKFIHSNTKVQREDWKEVFIDTKNWWQISRNKEYMSVQYENGQTFIEF